ncbi:MAG: hypothetical protein ACT4PT_11820 [Methanobacteriota archaeon]
MPVWEPDFIAVCPSCNENSFWHKANVMKAAPDGTATIAKGYKCAGCQAVHSRVVDTRGRIWVRE